MGGYREKGWIRKSDRIQILGWSQRKRIRIQNTVYLRFLTINFITFKVSLRSGSIFTNINFVFWLDFLSLSQSGTTLYEVISLAPPPLSPNCCHMCAYVSTEQLQSHEPSNSLLEYIMLANSLLATWTANVEKNTVVLSVFASKNKIKYNNFNSLGLR